MVFQCWSIKSIKIYPLNKFQIYKQRKIYWNRISRFEEEKEEEDGYEDAGAGEPRATASNSRNASR